MVDLEAEGVPEVVDVEEVKLAQAEAQEESQEEEQEAQVREAEDQKTQQRTQQVRRPKVEQRRATPRKKTSSDSDGWRAGFKLEEARAKKKAAAAQAASAARAERAERKAKAEQEPEQVSTQHDAAAERQEAQAAQAVDITGPGEKQMRACELVLTPLGDDGREEAGAPRVAIDSNPTAPGLNL